MEEHRRWLLSESDREIIATALALMMVKKNLVDPDQVSTLFDRFNHPYEPPLWKSSEFTEQEREVMLTAAEEGIDKREEAINLLNEITDLPELLNYMWFLDSESNEIADCLSAIDQGVTSLADYESEEFEGHMKCAAFIRRFNLVEEDGYRLSGDGKELLSYLT